MRIVTTNRKRKLSTEVASPSANVRQVKRNKCPFKDCEAEARRLKRHVQRRHIPAIFHDLETPETLASSDFQAQRLQALNILADQVMAQRERPIPESMMRRARVRGRKKVRAQETIDHSDC